MSSLSKTNFDGISLAEGNTEGYNMLNVFKFSSDNSNVEWSLDKFNSTNGTRFTISTAHNSEFSPNHESLGIATHSMISSRHSHPCTGIDWERRMQKSPPFWPARPEIIFASSSKN